MRKEKRSFWDFLQTTIPGKLPAEREQPTAHAASGSETALSIEDVEGAAAIGAGCVDDVFVGADGSGLVNGWAIDLQAARPAFSVHLFVNRIEIARSVPSFSRPDVATIYANPEFEQCGFVLRFQHIPIRVASTTLSVWCRQHDGTFYELILPSELTTGTGRDNA
jgi:hypothetical protein